MREIVNAIMLILLAGASYCDCKTRQIPMRLIVVMAALMCLSWLLPPEENVLSIVIGLVIGILFIGISRCTREAIGYGDSLILLILGGCLGGLRVCVLVMTAFGVASMLSAVKLIRRKWNRRFSFPFVPFLLIAYVGVMYI